MTVFSGFFNATSGDRAYNAEDHNRYLVGIITEGVIGKYEGGLEVNKYTGGLELLRVEVYPGKAFSNTSWLYNTSTLSLDLEASDPVLDRIDIVVLDFDKSIDVRKNDIFIVTGTPAATPVAPELINDTNHVQLKLAEVYIQAGAMSIDQEDITDFRGTVHCPFSQITEGLLADIQEQISALDSGLGNYRYMRNLIINGDMSVSQRGNAQTGLSSFDGYPNFKDRWRFRTTLGGTFGVQNSTNFKYRVLCTSSQASLPSGAYTMLQQRILGRHLLNYKKGLADDIGLSLSFLFRSNLSGNFVVELQDEPNDRSISVLYSNSAPGTWTRVEANIPADTGFPLSHSDTSWEVALNFWLSAGSSYNSAALNTAWNDVITNRRATGQANLAGATNLYFELDQVQLELGPIATPFEHRPKEVEFLLCQEYHLRLNSHQTLLFVPGTNTFEVFCPPPPITPRTWISSISQFEWVNIEYGSGNPVTATYIEPYGLHKTRGFVFGGSVSGLSINDVRRAYVGYALDLEL